MTENLPAYGLFAVDHQARTVKGILLPWGQRSRTSVSKTKPITFPRGSVSIPRDPSIVGLNRMHDRFDWLGRADSLEDAESGIVATFRIADTDEGDDWLADHGDLIKLSPEVKAIVRHPDGTGSAVLTSAALVDEGAFADAALFAIDRDAGDEIEDTPPDAAPAAPDPKPDAEPDEPKEDAVADAIAPDEMLGGRRRKSDAPKLTRAGFFAAMNRVRQSGDTSALTPYLAEAEEVGLFALSDIKFDGTGGLVTDAGIPGAWLGELWQGRSFQRKVVPLLTSQTLTSLSAVGWIWGTKPSMASWAGNKANVPSNVPTVSPKSFAAVRFAGGHDLAREYYDFNVTEVIDSYANAMVDSYAALSDQLALTNLEAGATAFTITASTTNKAINAIVDGALAVIAANATPSYALVAGNVFRDLFSTPHSSAFEYFDAAVGLDGGSLGGFSIIPDGRLTAGHIIVGAKEGATFWELPGVPIRVSAPDLVKGGVDQAFFGYAAAAVTYPAAVVKATLTLP